MDLCVLNQAGEVLRHRHLKAAPEPFLKAIAPDREDVVVCVEGLFTWYRLAALCAREGLPFGLGHALSMEATPGGQAKNATIDAHTIAVLRRGGMRPQAYVYPAARRATGDLRRRRMSLRRQRAALLPRVQQTNSQSNPPESGRKSASKANRDGVAARFPEPAVRQSIAVGPAVIDDYDRWLTPLELDRVQTATAHAAQTFYRWRPSPGVGKILALVLRYESHEIRRFPRGQECVSSCRLSNGRRTPRAHATAPRAKKAARPTSSGPSPRRRCASSATPLRARSPWPAWQRDRVRARP
jgi:transposase